MRLKATAVLVLALAIASCVNTDELRTSEPARTADFAGEYSSLTACIAYELADRFTVDHVVRDRPQIGTVSRTIESPFYRLTDFEVTVRQRDAGSVRVEMRARPSIGQSWTDAVWPSVERCAAT